MIYLFIAGSYTPWLTLKNYYPEGWSIQLNWLIWIFALFGIIYQQLFHEKYKWLETTIYVIVALFPGLAVLEMVSKTLILCSSLKVGKNYFASSIKITPPCVWTRKNNALFEFMRQLTPDKSLLHISSFKKSY